MCIDTNKGDCDGFFDALEEAASELVSMQETLSEKLPQLVRSIAG